MAHQTGVAGLARAPVEEGPDARPRVAKGVAERFAKGVAGAPVAPPPVPAAGPAPVVLLPRLAREAGSVALAVWASALVGVVALLGRPGGHPARRGVDAPLEGVLGPHAVVGRLGQGHVPPAFDQVARLLKGVADLLAVLPLVVFTVVLPLVLRGLLLLPPEQQEQVLFAALLRLVLRALPGRVREGVQRDPTQKSEKALEEQVESVEPPGPPLRPLPARSALASSFAPT